MNLKIILPLAVVCVGGAAFALLRPQQSVPPYADIYKAAPLPGPVRLTIAPRAVITADSYSRSLEYKVDQDAITVAVNVATAARRY